MLEKSNGIPNVKTGINKIGIITVAINVRLSLRISVNSFLYTALMCLIPKIFHPLLMR